MKYIIKKKTLYNINLKDIIKIVIFATFQQPYPLRDIINDHKTQGEWKIQLKVHSQF